MAEHNQETATIAPAPRRRLVLRTKPESLSYAAAVLGVIAAVISGIPAIGLMGLVPAFLALTAGITAMQLTTTRPGFAVAGVILGALAGVVEISMSASAG